METTKSANTVFELWVQQTELYCSGVAEWIPQKDATTDGTSEVIESLKTVFKLHYYNVVVGGVAEWLVYGNKCLFKDVNRRIGKDLLDFVENEGGFDPELAELVIEYCMRELEDEFPNEVVTNELLVKLLRASDEHTLQFTQRHMHTQLAESFDTTRLVQIMRDEVY